MENVAELIKQQIELIEQNIFVQITYENGFWCYLIFKLPTKEDIEFAESSECQDGDLWKRADLMNQSWFMQEQKSFQEALINGIKHAKNNISQYLK
jgi:hypothetical protein